MAHAIDRDLIVRSLLDDLVKVVDGPIQPLSSAYEKDVTRYEYNPARARALLDSAGWVVAADGIRSRAGTRLAFTLITQSGFAIRENVSQALQKQFKDVGIEANVRLIDGTSISSIWFKGDFDAMLHWWQQGADPEITLFFAADRMPPAGRNINYFRDDTLTAMLYASDRTADEATRIALLKQVQKRLALFVPELPLYNTSKVDAVPATLQGFTGNPTNAGPFWNVYQWQLTAAK